MFQLDNAKAQDAAGIVRMATLDDMKQSLKAHMDERMQTEHAPVDLVRGVARFPDGTEHPLRYHYRELRFEPEQFVGHVHPKHLYHIIGTSVHQVMKDIGDRQENGHWKLAAWRVLGGTKKERMRSKMSAAERQATKWDPLSLDDPKAVLRGENDKPQNTSERHVVKPVWMLQMAIVDVSGADWQDTWFLRTGQQISNLSTYLKTGVLPRKLAEEREKALEIITQFLDVQPHDEVTFGLTEGQIASVRTMLHNGVDPVTIASALGLTEGQVLALDVTDGEVAVTKADADKGPDDTPTKARRSTKK